MRRSKFGINSEVEINFEIIKRIYLQCRQELACTLQANVFVKSAEQATAVGGGNREYAKGRNNENFEGKLKKDDYVSDRKAEEKGKAT